MTDDTFSDDAWNDGSNDDSEESDFREHVEEIRERRRRDDHEEEQDDDSEDRESLDAAVERLSGRVYRVKYPDPADPEQTERKRVVADDVQPTAAGMAFVKNDGERMRVIPAPVDIKPLDDGAIRSLAETRRRAEEILDPLAKAAGAATAAWSGSEERDDDG